MRFARESGARIAVLVALQSVVFVEGEHMHKWIAGNTVAAAVLSMAVASAQTYPQKSDQPRTARSAPAARRAQPITVTGCVMHGILTNVASGNETASRSGSPSHEGTSTSNRNGTAGIGVAGSTSTAIGTRGTKATLGGNIDTEAHGAGTLGATDQAGSTVGAGATAGATAGTHNEPRTTGTSGTTSTDAASSYQLSGITNPNEYSGKRVEITGMLVNTRVNASARRNSNASSGASAVPMLRVTSVRVLGDTCQ